MPEILEGDFTTHPTGAFAVIVARFNAIVTEPLLAGALDTFRRFGVSDESVTVVRVPGSFEVPLIASKLAATGRYTAILCLGAIIKGDTDHYDFVAGAATNGIASAGVAAGIPIVFGVLTTDTLEQAIHRAGGKAGNKGAEAALTAIEMVDLLHKIDARNLIDASSEADAFDGAHLRVEGDAEPTQM